MARHSASLMGICGTCWSIGALAQEAYISGGVGGGLRDRQAWQSVVYTPFGNLRDEGVIVRGLGTLLAFEYDTSLKHDPDATITASGWAVDAEAGWQFNLLGGRAAAFGGLALRDYALSPDDPGSDLDGFDLSASLSATIDVPLSHGLTFASEVTWRPQLDEIWFQARPGMEFADGLRLGPELALSTGPDYTFIRVGAFATGFRITVLGTPVYLGAMAGVSDEPGAFEPFPYGGVWAGVTF